MDGCCLNLVSILKYSYLSRSINDSDRIHKTDLLTPSTAYNVSKLCGVTWEQIAFNKKKNK